MKTITYEQYLKQEQKIKLLEKQGVELIYKKSKLKLILGGVCIVVAIVPNGLGIIFYPVGFALLSSAGIDIYALIQTNKRKIRVLLSTIRKRIKC